MYLMRPVTTSHDFFANSRTLAPAAQIYQGGFFANSEALVLCASTSAIAIYEMALYPYIVTMDAIWSDQRHLRVEVCAVHSFSKIKSSAMPHSSAEAASLPWAATVVRGL
jgi:hypothetical protein